jgi:hypothetical protein
MLTCITYAVARSDSHNYVSDWCACLCRDIVVDGSGHRFWCAWGWARVYQSSLPFLIWMTYDLICGRT